jgi:hypothetical protein
VGVGVIRIAVDGLSVSSMAVQVGSGDGRWIGFVFCTQSKVGRCSLCWTGTKPTCSAITVSLAP